MSFLKIYFENKVVYLCDKITPEISALKEQENCFYSEDISDKFMKHLNQELQKETYDLAILYNHHQGKLRDIFFKNFTIIKAGGGVVKNENEEILLIFRRGKWDLPKGKLEEGEDIEECALREVMEETGIKHLIPGKKLEVTFHTYKEKGVHILKESHWYSMKSTASETLIPQTEEDIMEIKWVKKEDFPKYEKDTFPLIVDLLALV